MLLHPSYFKNNPILQANRSATRTPVPAVQFPWLPALTLFGIPAVVIFLWIIKHTLFGGLTFGWTALAELALPLGACIFATAVFLLPNPMHALLSLLGVFFMTVLFYLATGIVFVGLVFLIVYVGAVAVLFLFVIMLLNVKSLTSKDALLQHLTQWLAIMAAAILFQQLYSRVFSAVNCTLMGWNTQLSSAELTSAEAVLFYVRFGAADINRLVGLYTTHSPAFLVTTVFLLVSLLGAIILATVTTERATTVTDIREYGAPALAIIPLFTPFFLTGPAPLPAFYDLLAELVTLLVDNHEILSMSFWMKHSKRNDALFRFDREHGDGVHNIAPKEIFYVLPKFTATVTKRGSLKVLSLKAKKNFKRERILNKLGYKKAPAILKIKETHPAAFLHRVLDYLLQHVIYVGPAVSPEPRQWQAINWPQLKSKILCTKFSFAPTTPFYPKVSAVISAAVKMWNNFSCKAFGIAPANVASKVLCAKIIPPRKLTIIYPKISITINTVIKKWNECVALSFHQEIMDRACWLWRWRSERATSLLRMQRSLSFSSKDERSDIVKAYLPFWRWQVYTRPAPLKLSNLGPLTYLWYRCKTSYLPLLNYWAWRGRTFLSVWISLAVVMPLILVPFPWFLDNYYDLWPQLKGLHSMTYAFVEDHTVFTRESSRTVKELVTLVFLYPAAALNVLASKKNTFLVLGAAALYAYDVVVFMGGAFARAELHDSTCNYFRIRADKTVDALVIPEMLARARRHPDKGRRDLCLLLILWPWMGEKFVDTVPVTCPVSLDSLWAFLDNIAKEIRPEPPSWSCGLYLPWHVEYLQCLVAVSTTFVMAVIVYSLCATFIAANWSRVYKNCSRPSVIWPIFVSLIAIYLWICLYPAVNARVFPFYSHHFTWWEELIRIITYVTGFMLYLQFVELLYPDTIIKKKQLAHGNIRVIRRFVNYYYARMAGQIEVEQPEAEAIAALSVDELLEEVAQGDLRKKAERERWVNKWRRQKYVAPIWDTRYHDPEPNPECKPCRTGSAQYLYSPFTGRRFTPPFRVQARRPMPERTDFSGMFYPSFLLFINFPPVDLYTLVTPLFSFLVIALTLLSILTAFPPNPFLLTSPIDSPLFNLSFYLSKLEGELHRNLFGALELLPSVPNVLISFLPELTLAIMITYLIGIAAVELSANRAPKVLATECWRAACWGLAFIAFLYAIQLLGVVQNAPVASGYLYVSKGLTASKLFVTVTSLFVLHLSENYIREHTRHVLEFSIILLLSILLLLILVSANNLMLVFFSLAGFSLNLYILILYDGADAASREASLKYFYLSTLSAGFILFGILLIYVTVGDVTYYTIRVYMNTAVDQSTATTMSAAVLFILIGFFFKLSAFPGHLWAVEVYEGSPLPVMAFFVLPVKVAFFITFMRLLNTGLLDFSQIWLPLVTIAAIGSLLWGALAATQERKITRFLGYASINQIGFLLLGLVADTDDALRSAFFYLILYAVMTGGFLLVFTQLRKETGATFVTLSDFRGLSRTENLVCWNLAVFLFSMAGIPPLAGFFGKYYLLASLTEKGLFAPVVIGLAVSLITAYYYLRIIKTFWFEEDIALKPTVLLLSSAQRTLLSVLEASLWVSAVFAPWLLPILTDTIATLVVCADSSSSAFTFNILEVFVSKLHIADTCDPSAFNLNNSAK